MYCAVLGFDLKFDSLGFNLLELLFYMRIYFFFFGVEIVFAKKLQVAHKRHQTCNCIISSSFTESQHPLLGWRPLQRDSTCIYSPLTFSLFFLYIFLHSFWCNSSTSFILLSSILLATHFLLNFFTFSTMCTFSLSLFLYFFDCFELFIASWFSMSKAYIHVFNI